MKYFTERLSVFPYDYAVYLKWKEDEVSYEHDLYASQDPRKPEREFWQQYIAY